MWGSRAIRQRSEFRAGSRGHFPGNRRPRISSVTVTPPTARYSNDASEQWALGTARRSPWQNGYVERLIGSIRRECLDHVIIFSERHLRRVLVEYSDYDNTMRTHRSLRKDTPPGRPVKRQGEIRAFAHLGGLNHSFVRI